MKDFKAKFEEWWEAGKEYFTKELEKNLVQHRVDEKIMRYKLEAYQKNFLDFICGSPTSTEVSGQNEKIETGANEIAQEEEVHTKESKDFKSGATQEEVQLEIPQDLKGGGQEAK